MSRQKKIRLSKEASLLHSWLCLYSNENSVQLNIDAFKQWFESEIGERIQTGQIISAINELGEHDLIKVLGWQIQPKKINLEKFHPGF
ncbi:hypothetical protein LC608_31680 [Nostoc sp. XA010]|uniref:hypothetical protein n=1 Tax=Nostoc sp. XA010 TaxID=2780407 RepID=UPI001E47D8C6|nr:hypothetical protein [Nostoc sp. XA010]MCC5661434.1 hypothetical protein [Nostoc sp. XA010]